MKLVLIRSAGFRGLGIVLAAWLTGCASGPQRPEAAPIAGPRDCRQIEAFFRTELEPYQNAVDAASVIYQNEQWKVETAAPDASMEKMSKLFEAYQRVAYDKEMVLRTRAMDVASRNLPPASCEFRVKLTRAREMLDAQVLTDSAVAVLEKKNQDAQDALANKSNAYRITVPGETEPLSRALFGKKLGSMENRGEREKLYKQFAATRANKWIEWGFRDLIKARNAEGVAAGFKNYYEYRFFRNQLDLANYVKMVQELKTKLAPKMTAFLKKLGQEKGITKVEGWDLRYLREKFASGAIDGWLKDVSAEQVMDFARRFYAALGFNVDSYNFRMDLYPRAGKNTHAFAMTLEFPHVDEKLRLLPEPKMDIRFLANLKKPVHWDDISTTIHELGHAVHGAEIRQPIGLFRGTDPVETEAVAMTLERMANSAEFLKDAIPALAHVSVKKLYAPLKEHVKTAKLEQAFTLLRQVFFSDFEYEMYKNPDADFAALWSKMHADYWGVELQANEADWDVEHYVMAPVYVQNYAVGILMVEQLYDSMLHEFKTSYRSKALGDKLRNVYFAPGAEFDYLTLTQKFSGKPLSAAAALKLVD